MRNAGSLYRELHNSPVDCDQSPLVPAQMPLRAPALRGATTRRCPTPEPGRRVARRRFAREFTAATVRSRLADKLGGRDTTRSQLVAARWLRLAATAGAFVCLLVVAAPAQALIEPVSTIAGPSGEILELGGVAMAPDGTAGIVYRERVEGRPHIFAAVYADGKWEPPVRVDVGQQYESTFPAIAAGEGGRLIVVWVNHYSSTQDGLYSASLMPGADSFTKPVAVDLNVGDGEGTYPSVSMNGAGQALVAYRVVNEVSGPSTPNIPAGYVLDEIRMARSNNGEYWTSFGQPINRVLTQPVPAPTATNSPKVAIDVAGEGLVIWQEPDDNFVNRVYARRIFGLSIGDVLQVSPASYEGHPLNGTAEDLGLDFAGFGEGAVAWLQQPSPGSGFTRPRVFVDEIPSSFDPKGAEFAGAHIVDGAGAEGPDGPIGPLSVAVDAQGGFDVAYGVGDETLAAQGSEKAIGTPLKLDTGGGVPGDPGITRGVSGAIAAAWRVEEGGAGAVELYERRADGTPSHSIVSAPAGGAIDALDLAGSHGGDGVAGFLQGSGASTEIAAAEVLAPPGEFVMNVPQGWVTNKRVPVQWEPAPGGAQPVTYGVLVEGQEVAEGIKTTNYSLGPAEVGNGVHEVQIQATDALGQVDESVATTLRVDRIPPKVRIRISGSLVSVKVSDHVSGVKPSSVRIDFGVGSPVSGKPNAKHVYSRAGTYSVTVTAKNKAGLKTHLRRKLRIR